MISLVPVIECLSIVGIGNYGSNQYENCSLHVSPASTSFVRYLFNYLVGSPTHKL
jgi:hypothetical protein